MITFDAAKLKHPNTGLYHFTLQLARELEKCGANMDFFTTNPTLLIDQGCKNVRAVSTLDKILRRNPHKSNIWHTPYQFTSYQPPHNVKQILTVHDLNFLYEKSPAKQKAYTIRLQKEIDRADQIIAISNFSLSELKRFVNLDNKSCSVIYNGCNIPDAAAQEPDHKPLRRFIYGVGAMLPKKRWAELPELLVGRDDLELVLSGTGSGAYESEIMSRASKLSVADRVTLTGGVSEGVKRWYLENCYIFAFPSVAEGFGLPVVEALYHGKPLLISPHTSLPEVGGPNAHYLPHDFQPEAMRATLEQLEKEPFKEGSAETQRARAQSFSWEKAARQYLEIYNTLDR